VRVTGIPVKTISDAKHSGSIYEVFGKRGFFKNQHGAPCTMILKKNMRKNYQRLSDIQVLGYTSEEQARIDRFIDSNNEVNGDFLLMNNNIGKQECLKRVTALGIDLPIMYRLGYANNNCVGCVKGGMGYWNGIRKDFPEVFTRMAKMERQIGFSINKDKNGSVYLDELKANRGNFKRDMPKDCGFTCESPK